MATEDTKPQDNQNQNNSGSDNNQNNNNNGSGANNNGSDHGADFESKLAGKSQAELVKMYGELSRELGKNSKELGDARKLNEQMGVILEAIGEDAEREKMVKEWIENRGKKDTKKDNKKEDKQDDSPMDDTRSTLVTEKIKSFEERVGMDSLSKEERNDLASRIANTLWDMYDPDQKYKTFDQMVAKIPLSKLDKYLENAYIIANKEKLKFSGNGEEDDDESGKLPSMGISREQVPDENRLTKKELRVAEKLGIKPERYLAQKKQIAARNKRGDEQD